MLRETRDYLNNNFNKVKEEFFNEYNYYEKTFTGYWKLVVYLTLNTFSILMDRDFDKFMFDKDKILAHKTLIMYNRYYKKYEKILKLEKKKPKRCKANEIAKLVELVRRMDSEFGAEIKKLKIESKLRDLNNDF